MRIKIFGFIVVFLMVSVSAVFAQSSWLDRPLENWNSPGGTIPEAPKFIADPGLTRCRETIRQPESIVDRAVTRAGWSLFGASQTYGSLTVVSGLAGFDGMCRPTQYNTFVFVGNRFAGTLAPDLMNARSDGSLVDVRVHGTTSISADFNRYTSSDPLCCPSQTSTVLYTIASGARGTVRASDVNTSAVCKDEGTVETQDNVVSGTVTYRQRSALPATAVLTVKLVDVSRQDVSSVTVAERRIETAGKQVPFSFDMAYDRSKIVERNRYTVQAEIRDSGRLLFITDTNYPVITQGNPRSVEIVVVPVRGGGGGGNQGSGVIRGTVTYLQRIALRPNSEVTVRLVDSATPDGTPVAETTFDTNRRQVPIPFELRYEPRDINRLRSYELHAEIRTDGKPRFKTARGESVTLRGNQTKDIALTLQVADDEPEVITGKTLNLSKYGTGSMQIEGRNSDLLVRVGVVVRADGTADVSLFRITGEIKFSGKVIGFDENIVRIQVASSGDADASGEITVNYTGRRLDSITASDLVLDGQDVTVRF